uniref:Serpentine receptor class gamma n=1 Tax=Steinernema glaseri TaxID=37863 RepID=A0A1I7YXU2_9BILA
MLWLPQPAQIFGPFCCEKTSPMTAPAPTSTLVLSVCHTLGLVAINLPSFQMAEVAKLPYVDHVEFVLNMIAPAFTMYFVYLLRRPFFHVNLRILLANFSIGLMLLTITRNVILIHEATQFLSLKLQMVFHIVHNACVFAVMDAGVLIAGERLVATLIVDKYERVRKWWIAVGLCTAVVFLVIYKHSKRRWRSDLQKNLTHRYQIMENVRTSRQLLVALLFDFLESVYLYLVLIYRLRTPATDVTLSTLSQIFDVTCTLTAIFMPCLFIKTHPRLKYIAMRQLCRAHRKGPVRTRSRTVSVAPAEKVNTKETNIYFSQLEKSWALGIKK